MARQRRFAGQVEAASSPTSDQLTTATEALKAAGQFLKPSRGGRLGGSTAQEQQEGAAARQTNPQVFQPESAGAASSVQDIAKLRKDLGIDDLIKSITAFRSTQGSGFEAPQFEMPQFEMPQFEMPEFETPSFEQPNWEEIVSKALGTPSQEPAAPETTTTGADDAADKGPAPVSKTSRFTAGGINYNLSKFGGAGLGRKDVASLIKKNASRQTLLEFAKAAPNIGSGAVQALKKQGINVKDGLASIAPKAPSAGKAKAARMSTTMAKTVARANQPREGRGKSSGDRGGDNKGSR